MIEDALDTIKTARYQLGTASHLSKELDDFLEGLRNWTERLEAFFTDRSRAALVGALTILSAVLVSYLRGWFAARLKK